MKTPIPFTRRPAPIPRRERAGTLSLLTLALAAITFLALPRSARAEPSADGLYAGFLTSQGSFWCRLEFTKVPRTVASFVSLAEGTAAWVDFKTAKLARRPFYSGIQFHRVIDKFMIQSGSPNGQGTDGPGYQFADEFHATLKHSKAGTLSMANSGPNSNGSQFFVTVTNTPWLDGLHSVFGDVVEGIEVVHQISRVPVGAGDRPTVPVVINELRILRIGAAALAFDPAAVTPPLPQARLVPLSLQGTATSLNLLVQPRTNSFLYVFHGADLNSWTMQRYPNSPTNLNATSLKGLPRWFFWALDGGFEK